MSQHGRTPGGNLGTAPSAYSDPPAAPLGATPAVTTREVVIRSSGRRMSGKVLVAGTLVGLVALGAYLLPKLGWGTGGGKGDGGGTGSADVSRATPSAPQGKTAAASVAQTPVETGPLRIRVEGSDYYIGGSKVTLDQALERAKKAPKPPTGGAPVELVYTGSARAGAEETLKTRLKEMKVVFSEPEASSSP
jgi:hypothetical protein